jgi:hypothetical protein
MVVFEHISHGVNKNRLLKQNGNDLLNIFIIATHFAIL